MFGRVRRRLCDERQGDNCRCTKRHIPVALPPTLDLLVLLVLQPFHRNTQSRMNLPIALLLLRLLTSQHPVLADSHVMLPLLHLLTSQHPVLADQDNVVTTWFPFVTTTTKSVFLDSRITFLLIYLFYWQHPVLADQRITSLLLYLILSQHPVLALSLLHTSQHPVLADMCNVVTTLSPAPQHPVSAGPLSSYTFTVCTADSAKVTVNILSF